MPYKILLFLSITLLARCSVLTPVAPAITAEAPTRVPSETTVTAEASATLTPAVPIGFEPSVTAPVPTESVIRMSLFGTWHRRGQGRRAEESHDPAEWIYQAFGLL